MIGRDGQWRPGWILAIFGGLLLFSGLVDAKPRESTEPIGGITFDPPRRATIRHKNRQVIRGDLIGVSSELVHFRLSNGREFHYDLSDILVIQTADKEFRYQSAHDTYRELEQRASGLTGVTIEESVPTVGGVPVVQLPRPPAPAIPEMIDPPEIHRLEPEQQQPDELATARAIPIIPAPAAPVPAASGPARPIYETNAFKIGFIVACLAVIGLWWRNRVG